MYATEPFARKQKGEQSVVGVGRISDNASGPVHAVFQEYVGRLGEKS